MASDFTTYTRGTGNPIKDDNLSFIWICNHGGVKGPSKAHDMPWTDDDCFVAAYRPAKDDDPAVEDARIYETFNVIGHMFLGDPDSAHEIISRIIKGENHVAVCDDVLKKLTDRMDKNPMEALLILSALVGGRK